MVLEAGQGEDCSVEKRKVNEVQTHEPISTVHRTFGHATNLSLSKSNGFWSRPKESKFELLTFFSKCKSSGSRYRQQVGDAYTGFTQIALKETMLVIRSQW